MHLPQTAFSVRVHDNKIIVTLSDFCAIYVKPTNQPQLILKRRTATDDYKPLARAWQAANTKAREIGWRCKDRGAALCAPCPV